MRQAVDPHQPTALLISLPEPSFTLDTISPKSSKQTANQWHKTILLLIPSGRIHQPGCSCIVHLGESSNITGKLIEKLSIILFELKIKSTDREIDIYHPELSDCAAARWAGSLSGVETLGSFRMTLLPGSGLETLLCQHH
jgi:hypothetical protein